MATTTTTMMTTTKVYEARKHLGPMTDTAANHLMQAMAEVAEHGEQIVKLSHQLRDTLERTIDTVERNMHVNSTGVVQRTGDDLDRECALYTESIRGYKRLRHVLIAERNLDEVAVALFESTVGFTKTEV